MYKILLIFLFFCNLLFSQKDSINLDEQTLEDLKTIQDRDQLYRKAIFSKKTQLNKLEIDSLNRLQTKIDKKNIIHLIKIVEKHGYVDASNSNSKAAIYAVFMHTPNDFKKKAKKIIQKQYAKGNIEDITYNSIMWHLDNGQNLPFKIEYKKNNDSINN